MALDQLEKQQTRKNILVDSSAVLHNVPWLQVYELVEVAMGVVAMRPSSDQVRAEVQQWKVRWQTAPWCGRDKGCASLCMGMGVAERLTEQCVLHCGTPV
jgi:hypothetical protein